MDDEVLGVFSMNDFASLAYNFINFVYAKLELISKLLSRKDEADVTGLETEETSELMFTESSINIVMNISLWSFLWYFSECLKKYSV